MSSYSAAGDGSDGGAGAGSSSFGAHRHRRRNPPTPSSLGDRAAEDPPSCMSTSFLPNNSPVSTMPQVLMAYTRRRVRRPLGRPPSSAATQRFAAAAAALICSAALVSRLLGDKGGGVRSGYGATISTVRGIRGPGGDGRPVRSEAAGKIAWLFSPIFSLWYFPRGPS